MQSLSRQESVIFRVWMDMVWRPSPGEERRVSDACSDMGLPPVKRKILRKIHRFICFCNRKILWAKTGKKLAPTAFLRAWYSLVSLIPAEFAFASNSFIAFLCDLKKTELVRHNTHPYPNPDVCGYGIPARLMKSLTLLEFEGRKFPAVKNYDEYLSMLYGDYMKLPPKEKQKPSIHLSEFKGLK